MTPSRKKSIPAAADIPLRVRRRRDGSMALIDAARSVTSEERAFPAAFDFGTSWLLANSGIATLAGDEITLDLCNARATYYVTGRDEHVLHAELVDAELFDPPPIDEERAVEVVAAARAARRAGGGVRDSVAPAVMERILVGMGQMRPREEANTTQAGEA
jgi:hypothetical protein